MIMLKAMGLMLLIIVFGFAISIPLYFLEKYSIKFLIRHQEAIDRFFRYIEKNSYHSNFELHLPFGIAFIIWR